VNVILDALKKHFDNCDISNRFQGWSGHQSLPASISAIIFHEDMWYKMCTETIPHTVDELKEDVSSVVSYSLQAF
jgi:hypothetical protein